MKIELSQKNVFALYSHLTKKVNALKQLNANNNTYINDDKLLLKLFSIRNELSDSLMNSGHLMRYNKGGRNKELLVQLEDLENG